MTRPAKPAGKEADGEKLVGAVLDCLEAGMFIKDSGRRYEAVTSRFCGMVGKAEKDIIGRRYEDIFPGGGADRVEECDRSVLAGNRVSRMEVIDTGDRRLVLRISGAPLKDRSGRVTGICGVAVDVTGIERFADGLLRSQRDESIVDFAASIAHDFNNFIFAVNGYASIVQSNLEEGHRASADIGQVLKAAAQAGDYTEKLLDRGRGLSPVYERVAVGEMLDGLGELLMLTVPDGIRVEFGCEDPEVTAEIDRGQIERVLLNLFRNSMEALSGGGSISVESRVVSISSENAESYDGIARGRFLELIVSDDGEGIGTEIMDMVFEPFYSTKDPKSNMGLGLTLCRRIVRDHRGSIRLYSRPGGGTVAEVLVPVERPRGPAGA